MASVWISFNKKGYSAVQAEQKVKKVELALSGKIIPASSAPAEPAGIFDAQDSATPSFDYFIDSPLSMKDAMLAIVDLKNSQQFPLMGYKVR